MTPSVAFLRFIGFEVRAGQLFKMDRLIRGKQIVVRKRHYKVERIIYKLKTGQELPRQPRTNRSPISNRVSEPIVRELLTLADQSDQTHRTICKRAGLAPDTLRHWKRGAYSPTLIPFINLAFALGYRLKLEKIDENHLPTQRAGHPRGHQPLAGV